MEDTADCSSGSDSSGGEEGEGLESAQGSRLMEILRQNMAAPRVRGASVARYQSSSKGSHSSSTSGRAAAAASALR